MAERRGSAKYGFWGTASGGEVVPASAYSRVARTGSGYDNFCIFLDVGGATTITLLVANEEPPSLEGIRPDEATYAATTSLFFPASYMGVLAEGGVELKWVFGGAAKRAILIPDFAPEYARLQSSGTNITIAAGWIASGD